MNKGIKMNEVLNFWFKELSPKDWWVKNSDLDKLIERRFLETHQKAIKGELFAWRETALGRLAEIIVLDQFSRNIYRNKPESFMYDALALVLAQECVALGLDKELEIEKRAFIYLPYMHSESLAIHNVALNLFDQKGLESNLNFEEAHIDIIKRFSRYPHRNEILKRESTEEEIEFLKGPNSAF